MIRKYLTPVFRSPETLAGIVILIGLSLISTASYLVFHGLAEMFTIMVAWAMFVIAWNSLGFITNSYLLIVSIAFFFIGHIDLLHTLAYKDMDVFKAFPGANLATQLWIAARYLQSLTFLIAPLFIGRRLRARNVFFVYIALTGLLLGSIFYWRIFPDCYMEGVGLTGFKKISEYIISALLLVSLVLLIRKRNAFDARVIWLLSFSIAASIASELAFTTYFSVFGLGNLVGHLFKIAAFYFIYKAIIETSLVNPYQLLFRDLQQNKEDLAKAKAGLEIDVAERTAELRQSEEQIRASVEVLLDGFARMSSIRDEMGNIIDFRYEYINEAGCRLNRRPREETVGHTLLELLPAHQEAGLFDAYVNVVETGEPMVRESLWYEDIYNGKDLTRAFDIQAMKFADGFVATWRDVTERKRAEITLREANQLLERMFASVDFLIAYMDRDFNFIRVNCAYARADEKTPEYFIGKNHFDLYPNEENRAIFQHVVETGEPYIVQARRFIYEGNPERGVTYWNWTLEPVKNVDGKINGLVLTLVDVTERERAVQALRENQKLLDNIVDNSSSLIYVCDIEGRFLLVNKAFEKVFGTSRENILGQTREMFVPETIAREHHCNDLTVIRTQKPLFVEEQNRESDGLHHYLTVKTPLVDDSGDVYAVSGISTDITERRRAEETIQRVTEDLRRSNAELEQFAYVASHDLQEPLRMVSSYVQLLEKRYVGKLDSDANEFIAYAVDGAKRMHILIQDLLAYSRVTTRGNEFTPVSSEDLLEQAILNLQLQIEENGAKITHDPLPVVNVDPVQLMQVFQNLLGNAIKFRTTKPPCIHIQARQEFHEWVFSVRDNGIGIDHQFAERIFVIFQRLNDRQIYPGTGIGLAICKRIVLRHGGRIWVESQLGQGATFYFSIPCAVTK